MLHRTLTGMVVALFVGSLALAEETRGTITKVEDGAITIRTGGGFGGGFGGKGGKGGTTKAEEKTFKVGKDVKVFRVTGKDMDEVKLTLEELKVAVKVTTVAVTVTHEGETGSAIKVGGFGFGGPGGFGKGKKGTDKGDKKTDK